MVSVIFLDEVYRKAAPFYDSPVNELGKLKTRLGNESGLKPAINKKLRECGINDETVTIDDVIERQRISAYLAGKGVVVLYPESGSTRIDTGSSVFPYNVDPKLSLATLAALKETYQRRQQTLPFDWDGKEEELINLALEYISRDAPNSNIDIRGLEEIERIRAAKNFLKSYNSLKSDFSAQGSDFRSFVAMLAFAASYRRIRKMFGYHPLRFGDDAQTFYEFSEQPVREINLDEILGYGGKTPVKKYMNADYLARRYKSNKSALWEFVRAKLSSEIQKR